MSIVVDAVFLGLRYRINGVARKIYVVVNNIYADVISKEESDRCGLMMATSEIRWLLKKLMKKGNVCNICILSRTAAAAHGNINN
jgi:hypothetical protein